MRFDGRLIFYRFSLPNSRFATLFQVSHPTAIPEAYYAQRLTRQRRSYNAISRRREVAAFLGASAATVAPARGQHYA